MIKKKKRTPIKAIQAKCEECRGESSSAVFTCTTTDCALYDFRMGATTKESSFGNRRPFVIQATNSN